MVCTPAVSETGLVVKTDQAVVVGVNVPADWPSTLTAMVCAPAPPLLRPLARKRITSVTAESKVTACEN